MTSSLWTALTKVRKGLTPSQQSALDKALAVACIDHAVKQGYESHIVPLYQAMIHQSQKNTQEEEEEENSHAHVPKKAKHTPLSEDKCLTQALEALHAQDKEIERAQSSLPHHQPNPSTITISDGYVDTTVASPATEQFVTPQRAQEIISTSSSTPTSNITSTPEFIKSLQAMATHGLFEKQGLQAAKKYGSKWRRIADEMNESLPILWERYVRIKKKVGNEYTQWSMDDLTALEGDACMTEPLSRAQQLVLDAAKEKHHL